MPDAVVPPTEAHHLATFKSRGVAVPFTSPLLAGARVRETKSSGIELLVPSPSGGRGVYVLNWPGVRDMCHPTVHDTMLFRRFASLRTIDPASVRDAALDVARHGAAGRETAAAAEATIARDAAHRVEARLLLSMQLLAQAEPNVPRPEAARLEAAHTPDLDRRAEALLHRIAPATGRTAAQLAVNLGEIADVFAPLGFASDDGSAQIPRILIGLEEAQTDLSRWLGSDVDNDISGLGEAVSVAMRRTCQSGRLVLTKIRMAPADPAALLRRWIIDADGVTAFAARCAWLLDGWERLSLLWLSVRNRAPRRAALLEMAPIVPVLPREIMEWNDMAIAAEAMEQPWRIISSEDTWRTGGAAYALIERNEKLLAMSA